MPRGVVGTMPRCARKNNCIKDPDHEGDCLELDPNILVKREDMDTNFHNLVNWRTSHG